MSANPKNHAVTVGNHEFRLGEQVAPVYGGAVHYWRLARHRWEIILDEVKGMGLNTVSIYTPWEAHEIERGKFDFGEINPSNDLDSFLTLCEARNLNVVARLGPQINGEMNWLGFPKRILEDAELHALSAQGSKAVLTQVPRPVPALSYAADKFFDETALWYDALCSILTKHQYPSGRLVAAQADNEMVYFFHLNAYACDFSSASIQKYRAFLCDKYGEIETLVETYGRDYEGFAQVEPPRRFEGKKKEDIPYYADWAEYRERYLIEALSRLAGMLKARGLDRIPLFHNYPHPLGAAALDSGFMTPQNLPALEEKLDFVGFDIYFKKEMYDYLKIMISYVVGSSRYPYIPELFTGTWPWFLNPGDAQDEEFIAKAALMHGAKGFSRYVLVERNRWMASPIRQDGRVRTDQYEMFHRISEMITRHRLTNLRRQADVLLLSNRDYDRLEAASVLMSFPGDFLETPTSLPGYPNFMDVSEETFGFEAPIQLAKSDWFTQCYRGLSEAGYEFLISDTAASPARWRRYKAIILPSFEYMAASLQRALVEFAASGGRVVLGPRVPSLDERMSACETLASALRSAEETPLMASGAAIGHTYSIGQGWISHLPALAQSPRALDAALECMAPPCPGKNDPRLDVAIHHDIDNARRLIVFVANPSAEAIDAQVDLKVDLKSVTDLWETRPARSGRGVISDRLAPYTIKIYECAV